MAMSADSPDNDDDKKLIYFPSLAERDRIKRERAQEEAEKDGAARPARPPHVPFLNRDKIPPFTALVGLAFLAIQIGVAALLDSGQVLRLYYSLGFVPANYSGLGFIYEHWGIVYVLSPFTYGFLHGSWMHLVFNLVMWMALGSFFEKEFGTKAAIRFFFLCALGGALLHFLISPFSMTAVIGASASISGCFAVALVLFYKRGVMGPPGRYGILPILAFWLILMVVFGMAGGGMGENIAWVAHLGGFMTGLFYVSWKLRRSFQFWRL